MAQVVADAVSWRVLRRQKKRRLRNEARALIRELKGHECSECGQSYEDQRLLHFHHIDPTTKCFGLAKAAREVSTGGIRLEDVVAEVAKCEVLCRSCHTTKHWG